MANQQGQSFADLLKSYTHTLPRTGDVVTGTVISVESGTVRVDIGGMTTGIVRAAELFAESADYRNIKPGDTVEATVMEPENEEGEVELSFRAAGHDRVWRKMEALMKDGLSLEARVLSANKGGLMMQVDALAGFMPVSQLNPDHYPRVPGGDKQRILGELEKLIGTTLIVKVIDVQREQDKLIVSEKAVWEDEQRAVLESYKIGDTVEGEISALTSFGAFLKFGEGLEGLIHISEIVWQRIDHPRDVLKIGQRVKAQIIDLNKSKIYLSMKRLIDDPWKSVKERFKIGQEVEGEVHKVEPFGVMVKLDNEIHGLAHISQLSEKPISEKEVEGMFKVGEQRKFEIINIEPAEHRLGLKLAGIKTRPLPAEAVKAVATPVAEEAAAPSVDAEAKAE